MNRNIKVLVEKTQSVLEFNNVDITKLGELKDLLREKGVTIEPDDVFKEAKSKSIFTADDAILPSNLPWKGEVTNDLTFMVTVANKKIKSGGYDRKYLYQRIKELNLQDTIKEEEGKNFTQVASDILYAHIQAAEMCIPSITDEVINTTKTNKNIADLFKEYEKAYAELKKAVEEASKYLEEQNQEIEEKQSYNNLAEEFDF